MTWVLHRWLTLGCSDELQVLELLQESVYCSLIGLASPSRSKFYSTWIPRPILLV